MRGCARSVSSARLPRKSLAQHTRAQRRAPPEPTAGAAMRVQRNRRQGTGPPRRSATSRPSVWQTSLPGWTDAVTCVLP